MIFCSQIRPILVLHITVHLGKNKNWSKENFQKNLPNEINYNSFWLYPNIMNYCETLYPLRKHFSLISTSQHEFERKMPQLCGSAFTSSPFFLIFLISPSPSWVGDYDNVFSRETPCARTKNYKILTHFSRFLSLSYSVHVMKNYHFFFLLFQA